MAFFKKLLLTAILYSSFIHLITLNCVPQKQPPEMFYKKHVLENFAKFTGKHLCQSLFFNEVAGQISKNTFSYRTFPVVTSVILLSWLWNHVQSQQQKNKVRFVGSLRGGMAGGSGEASSFGWFLGSFWWFLLVAGDIGWFQVVCCFSSYANFTIYRRVISLLYSWTHVTDWGHSIFLVKVRQQEKDYRCLVT